MDETGGGWLWFVIDVILVAALGLAILYGYRQWRQRRKTPVDRQREHEGIEKVYREDSK